MKKLAVTLALAAIATSTFAQGLVKFSNNATTLVSFGQQGGVLTATTPGASFYYCLLVAPMGTVDPLAFSFAGIYATNSAATTGGRFQGGSNLGVSVAGWAAGESRSFEIAGWSANLGTIWNPAWLTAGGRPSGSQDYFGLSAIGAGIAGGLDSNNASIPALALVGAAPSISSGFGVTSAVPEPGTMALAGLGAAALMIFRRRK
jgi:hypothetical protein